MPSFQFDPEAFRNPDRFIPDPSKAREASIESYNEKRKQFIEDAKKAKAQGEDPEVFARRWGVQLASARRRLKRAGETALAEYFMKEK